MRKENKLNNLLNNNENIDLLLSYSRISDFDRNGPKALLERENLNNQGEKKGVKMGSIIDDLLFSRGNFNDKYYISEYIEPTTTLNILAKIILDNYIEIPSIDEIFNIIERNGLWKSTKNKDLIKGYFDNDDFWGYLKEQYQSINKTIITKDDKKYAEEIVSILVEHEYSKEIFSSKYEHYYQYKFEYELKGFKLRGIIDILSIDHENKKVYFKDLKTGSGNTTEFLSSFIKFRYYIQEAVYSLAFEQICRELNLVDYELQPFSILYISLKDKIPINFIVSEKWHKAALTGFKSSGYYYKGLYRLLDEIYFHWKNKLYTLPKYIYESKGTINLQDNFIELI